MTTDELILTGLAMTASAVRTVFFNLIVPIVALGIAAATMHRERTLPKLLPPARPVVEAQNVSLTNLPVRELRLLARAAGHKALARSGRKAQLLEVLA
jgi:hypothetical protein